VLGSCRLPLPSAALAPAGDGGAASPRRQSLLDTAEPIIPRANRDLEAILAHATALKALADACNAAECPVVTTCATAAALAQSLVDAETYLDAMLGALNRAAADSAAAHSNVVAQARITSVNLDRAIRSLALQEYFNKLSSMLFNIASLVDDINNMVKEGKLTPGDNWAAKADGFYEAAKDLEGVMTDGFKLGAELGGADPEMVKTPVGELTNQVFGTGEKTGLANDVKSSASDAANAIDELRKKAKEAKDAGKPLDGKDVLGGLAKAAGKIVYRDLKLISDRMIKESKEYVDELLKNLKAEERILADLFLQRMRIGERRFVAEDALARVRAAKTALLGCLSRSCGNPSLTRPRLPDYYAAPPGMRAEDLAKHFGWGTALRDLNPRVAAVEIALRERFTVTDSCPGGGGGGVDVRPGGIGVIPGIDPRIRELFRANCPECQPAADRLAAVLTERKFVDGEIARIEALGVEVRSRLYLSESCPLILPLHVELDRAREARRARSASGQIGTTGKGIGPAYEDKVARRAVRVQDLKHPERLQSRLSELMELHNSELEHVLGATPVDTPAMVDGLLEAAEKLRPLMADVGYRLHNAHLAGHNLLFEGAQGTLLDIDHGTYPFVTSSNCVAGNAAAGSGVGPGMLHYILGITKAYCTRVGLDGLPGIKVCVGYRLGKQELDVLPLDADEIAACEPVYEHLPGWADSTAGLTNWEQLPAAARRYLERVQTLIGAPIDMVSTGPDRVHTILLRHPYRA